MTIKEFMSRFNIKREKTIKEWITKGYIPGSNWNNQTNEIFIPDNARPPYTKARAKNSTAIYRSIVKACIERKYICADIYNLSEDEFSHYIDDLLQAEIISSILDENATYYYSTLKSEEFLKSKSPEKLLQEILQSTVESAAKGVTSAIIEKTLSTV